MSIEKIDRITVVGTVPDRMRHAIGPAFYFAMRPEFEDGKLVRLHMDADYEIHFDDIGVRIVTK